MEPPQVLESEVHWRRDGRLIGDAGTDRSTSRGWQSPDGPRRASDEERQSVG